MEILKTKGLVIKTVNYNDSNKIITVFSEQLGKISACAYGSRKPKSKLIAGTQLLCFSDFILRSGKDMYTVVECDVVETFFDLRNSIEKLSYAAYFVELALTVLTEQPGQSLLSLMLNTLHKLCTVKLSDSKSCDYSLIKAVYELRLMSLSGFAPSVAGCMSCGTEQVCYFDCRGGGTLCNKCSHAIHKPLFEQISAQVFQHAPLIKISDPAVVDAMQYILYSNEKKIFSFAARKTVLSELNNITENFIAVQTDKKFHSLEYLKKIC